MNIYLFDENKEFVGAGITMLDPEETKKQGRDVWLMPPNATTVEPALQAGYIPVWNGASWDMLEDHRERAMPGLEQPATEYWLPGDTHETPARHMTKPGPLPEGALLERPAPPELSPEEQQAAMQKTYTDAIQARLDSFAQTRGYDSIMSVCSYFGSANPRFKAEADRAIMLRDATWVKCYEILAEVLAGQRQVPTLEEIVSELPVLTWE